MGLKFEQFDADNLAHAEAAEEISEWSSVNLSMRFYPAADIAQHPLGILAFLKDGGDLAGYAAMTELSETDGENFGRVGALAVGEAFQGNGVAEKLVAEVAKSIGESGLAVSSLYAYVHGGSLGAFLKNGWKIIGQRDPPASSGCNTVVAKQI